MEDLYAKESGPDVSLSECKGKENNSSSPSPILSTDHTFPDGGRQAWMTVLGGWLSFVAGIGLLSSFSVFQSYYSLVTLSSYSADDISWISSTQTWGCFFFGIWAGRLSDKYGPSLPLAAGTFFMVFGTMMASVSQKYYQFMLSQGVCTSFGIGLSFTPALAIQSQWFLRKRGLVVGLVMSGQNIGGVIWPVVVNQLINYNGLSLGWTLRIIGFVQLFLMTLATLLIRPRFPRGSIKENIKISVFIKDKRTVLFTIATFIMYLAIYIPYIFITPYGMQWGASATSAFYYASILNAGGFFGCYTLGIIADAGWGFFDCLTVTAFASGIVGFAWMAARTPAGIIVWTVVYGVLSGALQAIFSPCISLLAPTPEVIGTWNGLCISAISFAVLGSGPIAGRLLENTGLTDYVPMQAFTGACLMAAAVLFLITRIWVSPDFKTRI